MTSNPMTSNKNCDLLYIIVTHYESKKLYNILFFDTNFTDLFRHCACIPRLHPKFKTEYKIVKYDILHNAIHDVTILQTVRHCVKCTLDVNIEMQPLISMINLYSPCTYRFL